LVIDETRFLMKRCGETAEDRERKRKNI